VAGTAGNVVPAVTADSSRAGGGAGGGAGAAATVEIDIGGSPDTDVGDVDDPDEVDEVDEVDGVDDTAPESDAPRDDEHAVSTDATTTAADRRITACTRRSVCASFLAGGGCAET
jgi:hypothetical protein